MPDINPQTPVLIGCGQTTDHSSPEEAKDPVTLMAETALAAAEDAGAGRPLLDALDVVVAMGLTVDAPDTAAAKFPSYHNVPGSVCQRLGISPARQCYTGTGGNTPQMMINRFAEEIASGECSAMLLTGAESLNGMIGRLKQGLDIDAWQGGADGDPEILTTDRAPSNEHETAYGLVPPANVYPLFENALRGKYNMSLEQHRSALGELFHRFTRVAAANPLSWFPTERSAQEISEPSDSNRYVGFPYTKFLNSIIQVNMGASVIMTSVARARELGVADDRMVFLHGCADANDIWHMYERQNYHSSPAMRLIGERAMEMAGKTIDDMQYFEIYSCFPSAVEIACDEFGIAHDDARGLTLTGGLPYFGGPGNNFVTHSIATMMDTLRADPGTFGLLNGNGWFITKHSLGIYSTTPVEGQWQREDPSAYKELPSQVEHPAFTETPEGEGTIETYTVLHSRTGAEQGIVIGRLDDGSRFMAETPNDPELLKTMTQREMLGARGTVSSIDGKNRFTPTHTC